MGWISHLALRGACARQRLIPIALATALFRGFKMLRTELKIASISMAAAAALAVTALASGLTATIAQGTTHAASYSVVSGQIVLND